MFRGLAAAGFTSALGVQADGRTSDGNAHPIDWIFTWNLVADDAYIAYAEGASDHRPLVATVRLRSGR